MKRFLRSITGKVIAFIAFVLSIGMIIGSVVGVVLMVDATGYNFYMNTEEELTEKLTEHFFTSYGYNLVWDALHEESNHTMDGNFYWRITDTEGNILCQADDWEDNKGDVFIYEYGTKKDASGYTGVIYLKHLVRPIDEAWETIHLEISTKNGSGLGAEFALLMKAVHIGYRLRYSIYGIAIAAVILAIASFISLMANAGHRPDTDELIPGPLYPIPFDLELVLCTVMGILLIFIGDTLHGWLLWGYILLCGIVGLSIGLGLCISFAVRIKKHTLITNTILYRIWRLCIRILSLAWRMLKGVLSLIVHMIRDVPLVSKTTLILVGLYFLEIIIVIAGRHSDMILVGLTIEHLLLIPAGMYVALCLRKLQKGGEALANGDLSHVTQTKGLFWDLKKHGDHLNSIAAGMAIAVEDRMKSERMRTELITNVSHDIKTPLTSIINYATLIGQEPCENEKITEYAEVLVRQSERMKRLTEDLVEASKAASGNLDVNLAPCDASVFITQAAGEYDDKMQKAELSLITKLPGSEIRILADGRHMWRVFDNLMNNICKYAQSGTRVYLSLEKSDGHAVFCFKNTSREPLDMSEDELLERFTRGDASRNTEGSGLGLAIAKSMTELQNGTLHLSVDGDLFKATLSFPCIG